MLVAARRPGARASPVGDVNRCAGAMVYLRRNHEATATAMVEASKDSGTDPRLVNLEDAGERAYWCKFFGVRLDQLIEAVKVAGPSAGDVRAFLHEAKARGARPS